MEQKIIDYIKDKYNPEVILLAGSRAKGKEKNNSDWDLFLLGPRNAKGEFIEFSGELLDITFKDWPEENKPLTIPYGPLLPTKVLLDNSNGKLQLLLAKTKEAFEKGPMYLYKESVLERFGKLTRWQKKIEKYHDNPMVEFFYAGIFYKFAIRIWFELQNKWSISPSEAIPYISDKDEKFFKLLNSFTIITSTKRPKLTKEIIRELNSLIP